MPKYAHNLGVTIYVCGMTPQDKPHMGHMLAFISADFVRRVLEYFGYEVYHVQNFTDIDDKGIAKAAALGTDPFRLGEQNIERYFDAADAVGVKRAHVYPRVTEHIPDIIGFIASLIDASHAYTANGSVYFDVHSYPAYGELSRRKIDDLIAGGRVDVEPEKRDALDFALWKAAKEGEPSWNSPWGPGRPGWHIECSAMSVRYLGSTFDLHGGGSDLLFPHHENELAQSRALGFKYAKYWFHNGVLNLGGEKMSKSTGNFFSMEDVFASFSPRVIRFYCLRGHFRKPREFSFERLEESRAAYERLERTLQHLERTVGQVSETTRQAGPPQHIEDLVRSTLAQFDERLGDDFDSEGAIGHMFDFAKKVNTFLTTATPE